MTGGNRLFQVTLDTNIFQELWKNQAKATIVNDLLALSNDGYLDLAVTTRIEHDTPRPPLSERIKELPALGVQSIGTVFRLNFSALGRGDMLSDGSHRKIQEAIESTLRARHGRVPEPADFDHIFGHHIAERDVFLTWDEAILKAADLFRAKLGVRIAKPEDFITELVEQI